MYTRVTGLSVLVGMVVLGAASCGDDTGSQANPSEAVCVPLMPSTPDNSMADPCKQNNPICPAASHVAVSTCCMAEAHVPMMTECPGPMRWDQYCKCLPRAPMGGAGAGAGAGTAGTAAPVPRCGDGIISAGEMCDMMNVPAGVTCPNMGMGTGVMKCNATCNGLDMTSCTPGGMGTAGTGMMP